MGYNNLEFKRLSLGVTVREMATKTWRGRGSHEVEGRRWERQEPARNHWNSNTDRQEKPEEVGKEVGGAEEFLALRKRSDQQ